MAVARLHPLAPSRAAARARRPPPRPGGDEAARSFLRMVSHELRTPLNAVIGFSEIIARELHGPIGDPRYIEHARVVRESGLNLLGLVNQILDLARLEQGAMELDLRPEPLEEVVGESFAAVADAAAARGVRLVRLLAADADRVVCDRRGLKTALVALLSNAVAASPPGGAVTLTARHRRDKVLVAVKDEGAGFDAAQLPRLMRPFEQGESALVRRTEGAGLGLPIARLLCRAMNGRLHLETAPGCGVLAVVRLPAAPEHAAPEHVQPEHHAPP